LAHLSGVVFVHRDTEPESRSQYRSQDTYRLDEPEYRSQYSSQDTYRLDEPALEFRQKKEIVLFSKSPLRAMGPAQLLLSG
jgi:hypothetical protein